MFLDLWWWKKEWRREGKNNGLGTSFENEKWTWSLPNISKWNETGRQRILFQARIFQFSVLQFMIIKYCSYKKPLRNFFFFRYLRFSPDTFEHLLSIFKQTTQFRKPRSAEQRLVITLWYLTTCETQESLSFAYQIGKAWWWHPISRVLSSTSSVMSKSDVRALHLCSALMLSSDVRLLRHWWRSLKNLEMGSLIIFPCLPVQVEIKRSIGWCVGEAGEGACFIEN